MSPAPALRRGSQRQSVHAWPSALLSSAVPPQPSIVRGCPVPIDDTRAGLINRRIKLAAQVPSSPYLTLINSSTVNCTNVDLLVVYSP